MKIKSSIGFIGCGNMGSSIVKGILTKGVVLPRRVYVLDVDQVKASRLTRSLGVRKARSLKEIAQKSHVLVLAVKPQQLQDLARTLKPHLQKKHIIISILAGTTLKTLKKYCGSRPATVRVMPNLGALVGEAMSVVCGQKAYALQVAKRIFGACGDVLVLRESYFDVVTAVSGSGPAYFFLLMELLEKEGGAVWFKAL